MGVCNKSYRKTVELLNRVRHQKQCTSYRSLNSGVEQEAKVITQTQNELASQILEAASFNRDGSPVEQANYKKTEFQSMDAKHLDANLAALKTEVNKDLAELLRVGNVGFEDKSKSVNISIDDVLTKRQVSVREKKLDAPAEQ